MKSKIVTYSTPSGDTLSLTQPQIELLKHAGQWPKFTFLYIMTLTKGNHYDLSTLTHTGWTDGDGTGVEGYNFSDYFRGGVYLGADQHGIEPKFEVDEEIATIKAIPGVIDATWATSPAAEGPTIMVQCGPEVDVTKLPGGVIDGSTTDEDGCFDVIITLN